jgi:hypothetical protein
MLRRLRFGGEEPGFCRHDRGTASTPRCGEAAAERSSGEALSMNWHCPLCPHRFDGFGWLCEARRSLPRNSVGRDCKFFLTLSPGDLVEVIENNDRI